MRQQDVILINPTLRYFKLDAEYGKSGRARDT
jgi:hypothetical protein